MYYNHEQKQRYIDEASDRGEFVGDKFKVKFEKISEYEEMLDKDACNFTTQEIISLYKLINTASLEYLHTTNYYLQDYTRWAINNGLVKDSQNHYSEIDINILKNCLNEYLLKQQIITRDELLSILNTVYNPSDAFLALACFEGVYLDNYNELYYVDKECFIGNEIITSSGRRLVVSDLLKKYAFEAIDTFSYYCYVEEGSGCRTVERSFAPDDARIFKASSNSRRNEMDYILIRQRLTEKMRRLQKYTGSPAFKGKALRDSGRIHMLKELKKLNPNKTYEQIIIENKDEIFYRYGEIQSIRKYLLLNSDILGE